MTNLDDLQVYKKNDPADMLTHLHKLPEQCYQAWKKAKAFKLPPDYKNTDKVVILGMGGSAIGGDLVRSLVKERNIILVNRDYDLPSFVDKKTLVIASSYSGKTKETVSAFNQALKTEAKKLVITTGGELKILAHKAKVPIFLIDYQAPPRAALGYSFIPLIVFLQKLGFTEEKTAEVEEMIRVLKEFSTRINESVPTSLNPAKQLATKLYGKLIVIYSAAFLSEVARRWKTQFNENSKTWAFYETFPELNHNAIVGYQFPEEIAKRVYILMLHSPSFHPQISAHYKVTTELLEKTNIPHQIIVSQGQSELSQLMSLIFFGDWVSYYLAFLYEVDPSPVKTIDYFKRKIKPLRLQLSH